ncbi:nucleotide exchange factor GrpE [Crocosphaera sp. XPORK-15E]|uniref:nucleotide exchange factor GrpE n=1 Tax=Crocosphaera sp. XPORK-15E TaxID=3110247 RepID=UPI002B1F7461|nr:nucleotide exchange factor GrpE [Crocosphaera sp. XPORK-15E]MEA5532816.1 nucleotide exchange factor GrpE [Crocosphaera sp. XPORK-15E]
MTDEQQQLETPIENPLEESVKGTEAIDETSTPTETTVEVEVETVTVEGTQEEPQPEQVIATLAEQIEALQQKLKEQAEQFEALKSSHIRLTAEFDNYRKRTAKEKQELETQVKCKTIGELLSVVDNFERARNQITPANDGEATIHKSYQTVYKNLVDSLKRLGVGPMRPEGQLFDPLYHEAMLREYTNEYPEGTIIEELVRGYLLGEQVLRHAMVKVAAPKPVEEEETPPTPAEPTSGD